MPGLLLLMGYLYIVLLLLLCKSKLEILLLPVVALSVFLDHVQSSLKHLYTGRGGGGDKFGLKMLLGVLAPDCRPD